MLVIVAIIMIIVVVVVVVVVVVGTAATGRDTQVGHTIITQDGSISVW